MAAGANRPVRSTNNADCAPRTRYDRQCAPRRGGSDPGRRNRRREAATVKTGLCGRKPLDHHPRKLPLSRAWWWDGCACGHPQRGQTTALAPGIAADELHQAAPVARVVQVWLVAVRCGLSIAMPGTTAFCSATGRLTASACFARIVAASGRVLVTRCVLVIVVVLVRCKFRPATLWPGEYRPGRFGFRKGGGGYVVCSGPGEFLLRREAAATAPALLGIDATAGMVLTWKRLAGRQLHTRRQRISDQRRQVAEQRHEHHAPVAQARTSTPKGRAESHGEVFRSGRGVVFQRSAQT